MKSKMAANQVLKRFWRQIRKEDAVKGFGAEKKHWNEESKRMRLLTAKGVEDEGRRRGGSGKESSLREDLPYRSAAFELSVIVSSSFSFSVFDRYWLKGLAQRKDT